MNKHYVLPTLNSAATALPKREAKAQQDGVRGYRIEKHKIGQLEFKTTIIKRLK